MWATPNSPISMRHTKFPDFYALPQIKIDGCGKGGSTPLYAVAHRPTVVVISRATRR